MKISKNKKKEIKQFSKKNLGRKTEMMTVEEVEKRYEKLFNSSPDSIIETDEKGNILAINSTMAKNLGASPEKLLNKNVFDIFPKEIAEKRAKIARKAWKEMKNQEYNDERAGRFFHSVYIPLISSDGKKTVQLIARDVTALKKIEEDLFREKEKYREIFEGANDEIAYVDKFGKVISVNNKVEEIFGYKPEEVIGKNFLSLGIFDIRSLPKITKLFKEILKTGKKIAFLELEVKHRDGHKFFVETSNSPVKKNGKLEGFIMVIKDVTKRKQADEALKNSQELFKVIFEEAPNSCFISDLKGVFIDGNKAAQELIGYKKEEIIGKSMLKLNLISLDQIPKVVKLLSGHAMEKTNKFSEFILTRKDGNRIFTEIIGNNIKIKGKNLVLGIVRDITEKKKTEEKLKEEEERYRTLFVESKDAMMTLAPDSRFLSGNKAAIRIFGCRDEKEFMSKSPSDLSPKYQPDGALSSEKARKMIELALKQGVNLFEWTHERINGEEFPATVMLSRMKKGSEVYLQATVRDITKQKKLENALSLSENRYKRLFDDSNDAIFVADPGTKMLVDCNKKAEKMTGYSKREIISMRADQIHPKDRAEEAMKGFEFQAKGLTDNIETEVLAKNGKRIFVSVNASSISIAGKPCLLGTFRDITEQKKMEIMIREEKNKLEQYFNIIGAVIIFFDQNGKIILINKKGCEILRYELKEILGKNWFDDFVLEQDRAQTRSFIKKLIDEESNRIQYFENYIKDRDGKKIFINWGNIAIKDESGKKSVILGTGVDVTELIESRVVISELNKINKLKDDFLNIATHELKTPLTSIIGFSSIMKEQNLFCSPEQKKYINIINEESTRLAGIVKRILMITRFESGREIIKFEPINLSDFISSFLIKLNILAIKEKSRVISAIEEENIIINSDEEKISEVIYNFIDNALKYGADEQTIEISARKLNKKWVRIAVKNQGKGIPQEKLGELFNKFSQLEPFLTRSQDGTGLGLYVCKIIINSLGGKIGVESEPDKGATFYIDLPLKNISTEKKELDFKAV